MMKIIVEKARDRVNLETNNTSQLLLLQRQDLWNTRHYRALAFMMGWNVNSLKRLFGLPGYKKPKALSENSEKIICDFLNVSSWEKLQQDLFKETLIKKRNGDNAIVLELSNIVNQLGRKLEETNAVYLKAKKHVQSMKINQINNT